MHICHFNAQSLKSHIDEIRYFFSQHNFDIIAVSESWLSAGVLDAQVCLQGYRLIRHDRKTGKRGGGVAVYFKESLVVRVIECSLPNVNSTEFMTISTSTLKQFCVTMCVAYRPNKYCSLDNLEHHLSTVYQDLSNFILMGDLNANLLSLDTDANDLMNLCSSLSLHTINFSPTHHTATSNSLIDVCLVDKPFNVISSGQSTEPFISHHDLIYIKY